MKWLFSLIAVMPLLAQAQELVKIVSSTGTIKQATKKDEGVQWIDNLNWEQIKAKAKAEGKFIFVDAYATWCAPCKAMDKNVFSDISVGETLNAQFISVKIQMDETDKDNENIKARYADARYINDKYKPEGYPCFLFFASDGSLAHRGIGFHDPAKFIALIKEALADPVDKYENDVQKFRNGQLEFTVMPALARLARNNKDINLSNNIAKIYKERYLDHLSEEEAFAKENLLFVADFYYCLLNAKDKFFQFFYRRGDKANETMNHPFGKVSEWIVTEIIKKEEITDRLYKDGKAITNLKPLWKEIQISITKKYGEVYTNKYFPNEQIHFYKAAGDWKNYVKYVNKKIEMISPKAGGHLFGGQFGDSWGLNVYTWDLFQYCNKKRYLKKGLHWIEEGILLSVQEEKDSIPNIQYLDTKANLLYRLGWKKVAIQLEQKAISLLSIESKLRKEYIVLVEKMKKGLPTWPEHQKNNLTR